MDWLVQDVPILTRIPGDRRHLSARGRMSRAKASAWSQADLARSLEHIARKGARAGFYEGAIAERICAGLQPQGSPLRADDFAAFHAEWVEPITATYRGYRRRIELPPNTQGFTALQILNLLEGYDVAAWGDGTADYYHHIAEAVKIAFADREEWLTEPNFVDIPVQRLIAKAYADERRRLIDPDRAQNIAEVPGRHSICPSARAPRARRRHLLLLRRRPGRDGGLADPVDLS